MTNEAKKDKWLQIRVTEDEHRRLMELSPNGMSVWVRQAINTAWREQFPEDHVGINDRI